MLALFVFGILVNVFNTVPERYSRYAFIKTQWGSLEQIVTFLFKFFFKVIIPKMHCHWLRFEFYLPQRPGAGANFSGHISLEAFWHLAEPTFFWARNDAPVTEH